MTIILDFIGTIIGTITTGGIVTLGDTITGIIIPLIIMAGFIITILVLMSLVLELYLKLMEEEEKE